MQAKIKTPKALDSSSSWEFIGSEVSMVIFSSSAPMVPTPVAELPFRELADEWIRLTAGLPRIKDRVAHPLYRQIVCWGIDVLPYLFAELKREKTNPEHWFEALYEITENDPIPSDSRGDVQKMRDAWLRWGQRRRWTS